MSADADKPTTAQPGDNSTPARDAGPAFVRDPGAMRCPRCADRLQAGTATVRGTVLGFLLVGFSHQHLFFKASEATRRKQMSLADDFGRVVLPSGERTAAARCPTCGLTVILP